MNSLGLSLLAALAGVCTALQAPINAALRGGLNSAVWANVANFIVGLAAILLAAAFLRAPLPSAMERAPWWAWTGGLLGAAYVGLAIFLAPRLGAAAFIALLIAGQMIASALLDHFGWLGLTQRPLDAARLLGVALVIAGALLIRR
ncbi:transporter family-2 protein [Rhodoblastus acidophilus]|uniref:DMT family transporter n=1 Tax=Rhodoblastus acidophilus TaxID=1074 RepID=UPI002224CB6D|nr:DMT family transporter [Rhodoblastus acidophilus]MCW2282696.1 transporter family-2 protein [Rhodoblastus acidophilus]MCW2331557.1 transporter family-2 protein [Rhodoblastus acidophilus]